MSAPSEETSSVGEESKAQQLTSLKEEEIKKVKRCWCGGAVAFLKLNSMFPMLIQRATEENFKNMTIVRQVMES